jgi:hypothetical protein
MAGHGWLVWLDVGCLPIRKFFGQQMPLVEGQSSSMINLEVDKGPAALCVVIEAATFKT